MVYTHINYANCRKVIRGFSNCDSIPSKDRYSHKRGVIELGIPTRYLVQSSQIHSITRISTPHVKRSLFVGDSIISGLPSPSNPKLTCRRPHIPSNTPRHALPPPPAPQKTHFPPLFTTPRHSRRPTPSTLNNHIHRPYKTCV